MTVTGIAASSPVSKAFLGLTSFPNLSLRLIGNQHDYSMPGTSTFITVCSQGHKLIIYCHVSYHLCLPLCKSGKVAWGVQRAGRFWRCSDRKAKAVSFWNILHYFQKTRIVTMGPRHTPASSSLYEHLWPWVQGPMSANHLQ